MAFWQNSVICHYFKLLSTQIQLTVIARHFSAMIGLLTFYQAILDVIMLSQFASNSLKYNKKKVDGQKAQP